MKELDIKKIYGDAKTDTEQIYQYHVSQSQLLNAIIIMQCVIENPNDIEINSRRLQDFVSQFEKS
jgi:hypothetical protein